MEGFVVTDRESLKCCKQSMVDDCDGSSEEQNIAGDVVGAV